MSAVAPVFDVVVVSSSLVGATPGPARLTLEEDIILETRHAKVQLPVGALTGCRLSAENLVLVAGTRGSVELTSGASRALAAALAERVCVLPELTLAMRSLGSRHGGPAVDHDRFFGPLLRARAAAEKAGDVGARMRSFDAKALEVSLRATIEALAAERHVKSPPHRRAMEAQITEFAEPLVEALRALQAREPHDRDAIASWCGWSAGVRAVFAESDRFWQRTRRFLDASPTPAGSRAIMDRR